MYGGEAKTAAHDALVINVVSASLPRLVKPTRPMATTDTTGAMRSRGGSGRPLLTNAATWTRAAREHVHVVA